MFLIFFMIYNSFSHSGEKPHLSVEAMEAIAKNSIVVATERLNAELSGRQNGLYPERLIRALKNMGKKEVTPEYLFDKCIYTKKNILSLLNPTLTLEDDAVATKNKKLSGMRNSHKFKLWRLIGRACTEARILFEGRLLTLTAAGQSIGLDRDSINEISLVMFFPTHIGRPSIKKSIQRSFTLFISTAVLMGTLGSTIGFPMAAVVLTVTIPVNSLWNYANNIVGSVNYNARLTEMITTGYYLFLDLKPEEQAWMNH